MITYLFKKVFRYRGKDVFELQLDYDDVCKCFILGGSIPGVLLDSVNKPSNELLETAINFKKADVFKYLSTCAEEILKIRGIEKHYFPSLFLDDKGNLNRENLHFYNNIIEFLNQNKPTYISVNSAPYLCHYFTTIYLSGLDCEQNKLIIHRIHRKSFEKLIITEEHKSHYIDVYRKVHFVKVICLDDGENFVGAVNKKGQVLIAFITYSRTINKIG